MSNRNRIGRNHVKLPRKKSTPKLKVIYLPIEDLIQNAENAKDHPEKQVEAVTNSVGQFGFIGVIVIDQDGMIISGHCRLEAATLFRNDESHDMQQDALLIAMQINQTGAPATIA